MLCLNSPNIIVGFSKVKVSLTSFRLSISQTYMHLSI